MSACISGWAQLIASGGMAPEKVPHGIFSIEWNAKSLNHIVDELLDASRLISRRGARSLW